MKGWLGCRAREGRTGGCSASTRSQRALCTADTQPTCVSSCQLPRHARWVPVGWGSHHDGEHAKVEVRADVEARRDADGAIVPRVLVRLLPLRAAPVQHHPAAVMRFGVSRDCAASRKRGHHGLYGVKSCTTRARSCCPVSAKCVASPPRLPPLAACSRACSNSHCRKLRVTGGLTRHASGQRDRQMIHGPRAARR